MNKEEKIKTINDTLNKYQGDGIEIDNGIRYSYLEFKIGFFTKTKVDEDESIDYY